MGKKSNRHEYWMKRCLVLAQKAMSLSQPNPMVGCVVVDSNKMIARGYHKAYGQAHAEAEALKDFSSKNYPNATLYVNLEPCAHHGQTGPCSELIVKKKIKTVVYGCHDPNPKVAGKGVKFLKDNGVEVIGPVLEEKCRRFNRAFFYAIQNHKPYITVKFAQSKNGFLGSLKRQEKISGLACLRRTMKLRALSKAIMVGVNTVNVDNPRLNVRFISDSETFSSLLVVVDPNLKILPDRKIFKNPDRVTVIYDQERYDHQNFERLKDMGVHLFPSRRLSQKGLNLNKFWNYLYDLGVHRVLVEGGSRLIEYLDEQGEVNEYCIYYSKNVDLKGEALVKAPKIKALQQSPCFVINTKTDHIKWYKGDTHECPKQ